MHRKDRYPGLFLVRTTDMFLVVLRGSFVLVTLGLTVQVLEHLVLTPGLGLAGLAQGVLVSILVWVEGFSTL